MLCYQDLVFLKKKGSEIHSVTISLSQMSTITSSSIFVYEDTPTAWNFSFK